MFVMSKKIEYIFVFLRNPTLSLEDIKSDVQFFTKQNILSFVDIMNVK